MCSLFVYLYIHTYIHIHILWLLSTSPEKSKDNGLHVRNPIPVL